MPRLHTIIVADGSEGRGYGGDVRFELTGDERRDIAEALEIEHGCDDPSCDIAAAMNANCPYSAAYFLTGATETPLLDSVLRHYGVDTHSEARDWNEWVAYHSEYGVKCESCDAYTYCDGYWIPAQCGNCGDFLPSVESEDN